MFINSIRTHVNKYSAHLLAMKLIDVTDDTVNVQKTLMVELKKTKGDPKYTPTGIYIYTYLCTHMYLSQ